MEDINDARASDAGGIVDAGIFEIEVFAKLLCPIFGDNLHILFGAEV